MVAYTTSSSFDLTATVKRSFLLCSCFPGWSRKAAFCDAEPGHYSPAPQTDG
ncbi:hypothetical protein BaRGS_00002032, partial [Batillaria attramentaria]